MDSLILYHSYCRSTPIAASESLPHALSGDGDDWKGVCKSGLAQSPIDLNDKNGMTTSI